MTIKEISALRKSGQLEAALKAAEAKFQQDANSYTASALSWCHNDLYKQQSLPEATETIRRMQSLYDEHCSGDKFIHRSLQTVSKLLLPDYPEIKEALDKARIGEDATRTCLKFIELFNQEKLDRTLYGDFGWLIY